MSRAVSSALASSAADTGGTGGGSRSNEKEGSEGPLSFAGPLSNMGEIFDGAAVKGTLVSLIFPMLAPAAMGASVFVPEGNIGVAIAPGPTFTADSFSGADTRSDAGGARGVGVGR